MSRGDIDVNTQNSAHAGAVVEVSVRIACSLLFGREHLVLKILLEGVTRRKDREY